MWGCRASSVLVFSFSHILLALAKANIEKDIYKMMNFTGRTKCVRCLCYRVKGFSSYSSPNNSHLPQSHMEICFNALEKPQQSPSAFS